MFRNIIVHISRVLRGVCHVPVLDFQVHLCKTHVFLKVPLNTYSMIVRLLRILRGLYGVCFLISQFCHTETLRQRLNHAKTSCFSRSALKGKLYLEVVVTKICKNMLFSRDFATIVAFKSRKTTCVLRDRSESQNRSGSLRISQNRSESLRVVQNRSESLKLSPSLRVAQKCL